MQVLDGCVYVIVVHMVKCQKHIQVNTAKQRFHRSTFSTDQYVPLSFRTNLGTNSNSVENGLTPVVM